MHSQDMYFELGVYFLKEYTTQFSLSGSHSREKYGLEPYICLIGQGYGVYLNAPPAGILQACWSPNTTPVVTAIPDVILKPV